MNAGVNKGEVAKRRTVSHAEQSHIVGRNVKLGLLDPFDCQARDGVTAAVKDAYKLVRGVADWCKALATVPGAGACGIDICTQEILAVQIAVDALQVGFAFAARRSQAGDDGVILIIDAQKAAAGARAEVHFARKAGRSQAVVNTAAAAAAAGHLQRGCIRSGKSRLDIDVAVGRQGQLVGAPADRR